MGHHHGKTIALLVALIVAAGCRPLPSTPLAWTPSLPIALENARQQGKPVFLYVTATWCNICSRVEKESLGSPDTVSALEGFVPVMVDIDQYPWVGRRYEVPAVPAFLVLDSRGKILSRSFGFHSADELTALLRATVPGGSSL